MLNRKLLRELYRSKILLAAITGIIAVGVMCYVAFRSSYHNLSRAKESYYRQCRMADFWIDVKKVSLANLDVLKELPGVAEINPRIQFSATIDLDNVDEPLNAIVLSAPDKREPILNDMILHQGGYFTDRRRNEVIVSEEFAKARHVFPGQKIHLLVNNRRQELFVVGTAISSEFTYMLGPGALIPDPKRFGVFYIKRSFAEDVFDFQGAANQIVGRWTSQGRRQEDENLRRIELLYDAQGVFAATPLRLQPSNQFLSAEIDGLGAFASVMPIIFLTVAALILNVLITRLARRERIFIGTLKAIGYSDWSVFFYFLKFGLCVGVAGGVLGGILGYITATLLTSVYRFYFQFPDLRSGFYWQTHAVGLAVSLLCAALGALYGARSVLKLQPAEAMRPEPPKKGGKILLEQITWLWKSISATWRIALRGVFRARLRTAAGVFASAMGTALLVTGFMMIQSQNFLIDFQFYRVSRSEIDLTFESERGRDALDEVRRMPGVKRAEPMLNLACTFVHGPYRRKEGVMGLASDATLTIPRDVAGRALRIPPTGLVLSRRLAEILHVTSGDELTMIPVKGERRPVKIVVEKIADTFIGAGAYARIEYLSHLLGEDYVMTGAQLLSDGDSDNLRILNRQLKQTSSIQSVNSRRSMVNNLSETLLKNQFVMIGLLVVFAGVIFFGGVLNASIVSLAERRREIATFLTIGYSPWGIGQMFLRESMTVNVVGVLAGLPLGYLLMHLTASAYDTDMIRLPVVTAPWIWSTTFILSVVFTLSAHAVVQWNIHHMNYLEALNVQQ